jgi:dipeptidase D
VVFALQSSQAQSIGERAQRLEQTMRASQVQDPQLRVSLTALQTLPKAAASIQTSDQLIALLQDIAQGVYEWSAQFAGLPETSNNIGLVRGKEGAVVITVFHRSFHPEKLQAFAQLVQAIAADNGATTRRRSAFPTWPPQPDAELYRVSLSAYQQALGQPLQTVVVHAGLECGFMSEKYPGMEIISIGPTLLDVHTPTERLYVPSVERISVFLRQLLKDL